MSQFLSDSGSVASEKWAAKVQALPADEQTAMLSAAVRLLQSPEAISTPLESELQVLAEQVYLSLGRHLLAR